MHIVISTLYAFELLGMTAKAAIGDALIVQLNIRVIADTILINCKEDWHLTKQYCSV